MYEDLVCIDCPHRRSQHLDQFIASDSGSDAECEAEGCECRAYREMELPANTLEALMKIESVKSYLRVWSDDHSVSGPHHYLWDAEYDLKGQLGRELSVHRRLKEEQYARARGYVGRNS